MDKLHTDVHLQNIGCELTGPNFIELRKAEEVAQRNKSLLTRIRLPAKLHVPCQVYNLCLVHSNYTRHL